MAGTSRPCLQAAACADIFLHACSGKGYSVTNTLIANGRGNAAIVRGQNGVLSNNNVSYVALNSFNFAPGFDSTYEGGFSSSLTARIHCHHRLHSPPMSIQAGGVRGASQHT